MNKRLFIAFCFILTLIPFAAFANPIDSLEVLLREKTRIQEKIYLHTDNTCYFAGDTIWYKAYVLRADNLQPTGPSKVMYVELLTPDGYVVERQRVLIDNNTRSAGQFCLPDTIYSGYYELRAYTRWQLNFNVTEKEHSRFDDEWFYSKSLAKDFFRNYEGLYSRVLPIYEKPSQPGDYSTKRIIDRPRRRLAKETDYISVQFYPEGGHLIDGLPCRVAYEVLDSHGKPLDIPGTLSNGQTITTIADGRGIFSITPSASQSLSASFTHEGKSYKFSLPDVQKSGINISYDVEQQQLAFNAKNTQVGAVSVACRGKLMVFQRNGNMLSTADLPTGVNEVVAYDEQGQPVANRQIFVNRHDLEHPLDVALKMQEDGKEVETISAGAYQRLSLNTELPIDHIITVSVSVRDQRSDELSYDDGNILTDMLLAGDLRGFVAHPAYYFESDDAEHRQRLDLLLMIQGWRKYAPVKEVRYHPERGFTLEGQVHPLRDIDRNTFDLLEFVLQGEGDIANPCFTYSTAGQVSIMNDNTQIPDMNIGLSETNSTFMEDQGDPSEESNSMEAPVDNAVTQDWEIIQNEFSNHKKIVFKQPLLVEAELSKDKEVAGAIAQADDQGHFLINLPPFYDQGIVFMTSYYQKDSATLCLTSPKDKDKLNPFICPQFYTRLDMFYPVYSQPYAWQQTHQPADPDVQEAEAAIDSLLGNRVLENVTVKSRRIRKLHRFDKSKPAFEVDFYRLLNRATDYGLHFRGYNSILFWEEAARSLFGNMGNGNKRFGIQCSVDGHIFVITHQTQTGAGIGVPMTPALLNKKIDPRNIWKVRIFTDYDMRNDVGREENRGVPDVYFEVIPVPNDGTRTVRRDRRMVFDGFAYPEEFYSPDYSNAVPDQPTDYRRTLYWNPNAHPDKDGKLTIPFYNNARSTRMQISVCGVGNDGLYYNK